MAEAALCTLWGTAVPGREKAGLEAYTALLEFWGRLQQEGKIERFDVAVLSPTGGDVSGFLLVRGTAEQIDSIQRSEEYRRLVSRAILIAQNLRIADAFVDEGLAQGMTLYQDALGQLD